MSKSGQVLDFLANAVKLAETLLPIVNIIGSEKVKLASDIITAASEIGREIKQQIDDGRLVFGSGDEQQIQAVTKRLAAANDKLAAYIATS